jgi:hypothetical protein
MTPQPKLCLHCNTEYRTSDDRCPRDGTDLIHVPLQREAEIEEINLSGAVIAERFHVYEQISSTASTITYAARDIESGRHVRVKVLKAKLLASPGSIRTFQRQLAGFREKPCTEGSLVHFGITPVETNLSGSLIPYMVGMNLFVPYGIFGDVASSS